MDTTISSHMAKTAELDEIIQSEMDSIRLEKLQSEEKINKVLQSEIDWKIKILREEVSQEIENINNNMVIITFYSNFP